jgi:hypothetical protein
MKIKRIFLFVLFMSLILVISCEKPLPKTGSILVILNSNSPAYCDGREYVIPYLDHFGLPYNAVDLRYDKLPEHLEKYALLIVGHKQIDQNVKEDLKLPIKKAVESGAGLVSFDFHFTLQPVYRPAAYIKTKEINFADKTHYILTGHKKSEKKKLFGTMSLPVISAGESTALLSGSGQPLLLIREQGKGKIAVWTSMDWMKTFVLGPLGGIDDCLWRSFVWAARKPFAFRGLAPVVTMRIDDVAGQGHLWGKSHLYWVKTANRYGFKPFLALFIYNLRPKAIEELRGYLLNGQATASPHAFGRPPRSEAPGFKGDNLTAMDPDFYKGFYYYPDALELRGHDYDEYIYYDHHNDRPWSDAEAKRGLKAVDDWYAEHQPLPMSHFITPHWGEYGSNVVAHWVDKWGIEYLGDGMEPDVRFLNSVPWLKAGPFRLYEEPGTCALAEELRGKRPIYYADFADIAGRKLFVSVTEIREFTAYEWGPNNNVDESVERAVKILKRELNSMALAVLFTHETDFIYKIKPENWDLILKGVKAGIADYNPILMNLDDAVRYQRAVKTSKFQDYTYDRQHKTVTANFSGNADVLTHFYLFTEKAGEIQSQLVEIPSFENSVSVQTKIAE